MTPWNSSYGAGVVMVPKKKEDGSIKYRITVDFRRLNEKTITEIWPHPLITENLANLTGCKYFTIVDLLEAFHQIPIHPDDQHKTIFIIPQGKNAGTYMYQYLAMGLKNSAASFQRFVDGILHGLQPLIVMAYVDDLIIFSKTIDENITKLRQVFERLEKAHMSLNLEKCTFAVTEISYLGNVI